MLGLPTNDAEKHNAEFLQYDRMVPVYKENDIQPALLELRVFCQNDASEEALLASMKRFHVIQLVNHSEGIPTFTADYQARAAVVGRALARYVSEGGGLLIAPQSARYANTEDELYWNAVYKPLGLTILHEGVYDKTRVFEGRTVSEEPFFFTTSVKEHPVTQGVKALYLPLHGSARYPGVAAMAYSPEWTVVVQGEADARSYRSTASGENAIDLNAEGTYTSAPPIVAVREYGKGRVVCYPLSHLFLGMNHRNPLWPDTVETNGDPAAGRSSDSMKLIMNAFHWLAEPAEGIEGYGTYKVTPYAPVSFPRHVDWDQQTFTAPITNDVRGIVGAHTAYTDGKGTVAEYVAAARAAGLSFIVFADPLEQLSKETLARLKADCAAASLANDFYACPGIEFTDGIGNRWAFWGESIAWPRDTITETAGTYVQWDGERIHNYGAFAAFSRYSGSALLDYDQLRANGAHAENLWWFFHYVPFVYEGTRLIADNMEDYLFGLRDLRWAALSSFTRIHAPAEVAAAADTCFMGMRNLEMATVALNTRTAAWGKAAAAGQYVSQGPVIASWDAIDSQMEDNWQFTRGAQRVRVRFVVRSDDGIQEVKVHDDDHGPVRRFLGHGARELTREFEFVHDRQHHLVLEVTDTQGRRAVSYDILVFSYKGNLFRCSDNNNILGPTQMCWIPDRNEFFNAAKGFRNGSSYALRGYDTSSTTLGVPTSYIQLSQMIGMKGLPGGRYPDNVQLDAMPAWRMDVGVNSHNMQIATMRSTMLAERYSSDKRPTPAMATVPRDVMENEYFDRTHTLYAPMEKIDMYVTGNHRRVREGRKNYKGAILWHEGEIRFKKDCTLSGQVPIALVEERFPTDLDRRIGELFIITEADGSTEVGLVRNKATSIRRHGRIRPGGYAATMTTPVGYFGVLVPADMTNFVYQASLPGWVTFTGGLGYDGQQIKAGDVIKYRFGVGTFADEIAGSAMLEHTVKAMNMGGGHDGYPVEMTVGTLEDATFFFTARSTANEAAFTLGPQELMIDLPIRVHGLLDNGCAALYSTLRPWFRYVPVDEHGTAWFQESIDRANSMWVGNVFVCDNSDVKLTLVVDGQTEGAPPFLELHNPTDHEITTSIHSPANTPIFGGISADLVLSAGDSTFYRIQNGQFVERKASPDGSDSE